MLLHMSSASLAEIDQEILHFYSEFRIAANSSVVAYNVDASKAVVDERLESLTRAGLLKPHNLSDRLYVITDEGRRQANRTADPVSQ